jgi:outer membrane biogenesis lipoprotein LolB
VTALGLGLTACASRRPPPPPPVPETLPSATDLTDALVQRREALRGVRGFARMRYREGSQTTSSREAIVVERPDRLRVEVLSALGSVFVLTAENGSLRAYARNEHTVYHGAASPENLARYAGLGMPITALVDLVLGTPPPSQSNASTVGYDPASGWIGLSEMVADGLRVTWFASPQVPVLVEQRGDDGEVRWRATFDRH